MKRGRKIGEWKISKELMRKKGKCNQMEEERKGRRWEGRNWTNKRRWKDEG